MSDPVTNVEIEDVLSSIRRLVSEGEKARSAPPAPQEEVTTPPEKLVLTPALRVSRDSDQDTAEETEEPVAAMEEGDAQDDVVADDWPTQGFEWRDDQTPAAEDESATPEDIETSQMPEVAGAEPDDMPVFTHVDRSALEEKIAELEAAVTAQPEEWEPDGSEVATEPSWPTEVYSALADVEDAEEVADEAEAPTDDNPKTETAEAEAAPEQDTEAPFEHLASRGDQDALLGAAAAETVAEDDTLSAYLADESVVDEAALREIVLDIVRQELQGKLGERITRNVRKLVRREIMRVLNAQDID